MSVVDFDYWMFLAGLGIFLFGMNQVEVGLKGLAGKSFKKLLQRFTNKSWKGIITGTAITAVLQSSSLVTLLVLAFLGSGMISLQHSLGVVLGANLGTTVTAWIVAVLGFKMNIADLAFPFIAIGAVCYIMLDKRPVLKNMGVFLIGFGLLFLGLDYMKAAIDLIAGKVDFTEYAKSGLWVFLLIGLLITALIQSSSAMIVIVLSALNSQLISVEQSVALVIGSSIGTTSTLFLASIKGTADKKRLAFSNVIFKAIAGLLAFAFIHHLIYFTVHVLHINDPLMELVWLNTFINLIGIVLFYPFLIPFGRFIKKRFIESEPDGECRFIKNITAEVPDVALKALDKELKRVFLFAHTFILDCLKFESHEQAKSSIWNGIFKTEINLLNRYYQIKRMEDEITEFYTQIQEHKLSEAEADLTAFYMIKLRAMIYSSKNIKDIIHNIKEIADSEDDKAIEVLKKINHFSIQKIDELKKFVAQDDEFISIQLWQEECEQFYNSILEHIYKNINQQEKRDVSISSLINVVRKTVSALEDLAVSVSNKKLENETMTEVGEG
jgi:phosphate:Na+ symporter